MSALRKRNVQASGRNLQYIWNRPRYRARGSCGLSTSHMFKLGRLLAEATWKCLSTDWTCVERSHMEAPWLRFCCFTTHRG